MDNKSKADRIFDLLPDYLNARQDPDWSSLIGAIGAEDDRLVNLIEEVRKQFFVKTASRPYLDRLAANNNLTRPRFVGMSDSDFRSYVPILSYQPKQVRRIIDQLLDLFFFKDATTAFLSSGLFEPFSLQNGWTLQFNVDNVNIENITFRSSDFGNINAATADEVVAAYNRQAQFSFAISYFDSVTKHTFVRIFTNTIGAQGSLVIDGGLANIGFQFNGFLTTLGTGSNTQWNVTKVGDTVTFTYTGGALPGISSLEVGDLFLCNLSGNVGTFPILSVDAQNNRFTFTNLLATVGSVTQISVNQTKYLRPVKVTAYTHPRRALAWETAIGAATVELPTTPPIVQRGIKGGFHVNGNIGLVTSINSNTSLTVFESTDFPSSGYFFIEPIENLTARLKGGDSDDIVTYSNNGRVISTATKYHYSSLSSNVLSGITPDLPTVSALNETAISSLSKTSGVVTCVVNNNFSAGDKIFINDSSGIPILITTGTTATSSNILTSLGATTGVSPDQLVSGTGIPAGTKVLSVTNATTVVLTHPATASGSVAITFYEDTNGAFDVQTATSTAFTYNQLGTDGVTSLPGVVSREQLQLAANNFKVIVTTATSSDRTKIKGPYVWDLKAPFVLSSYTAASVNQLQAGKIVKLLRLNNNTLPEGSGFIIVDYGQNNQEGPIRYLYKAAPDILALDPSYVFQQNHAANCSVVALNTLGPYIPSGTGKEFPPYATNPSDARLILQDLITSVASAGIFIDFIVRYPSQLYGTLRVYD